MSGRFLWEAGRVTNDLSIDIDQIRSALTHVLNAVERDHGTRLHLDGDVYGPCLGGLLSTCLSQTQL